MSLHGYQRGKCWVLLPQECKGVRELMTMLKACSAGREMVSPRVLVLPLEMLSLHREGWDYLWLSSCCVDAHLSIPCAVNNLLTQPWFTPTPSRYLHLPLSNRFFLWLLKLTHFDILRGEKWEVLLEIALMGCTGEALFEEQAQESPLWALF